MPCSQACPWASHTAVSLPTVNLTCRGEALKCLLLQSLFYVHCTQIRMNSECKSSYQTQAVTAHVKNEPHMTRGGHYPYEWKQEHLIEVCRKTSQHSPPF